MKLSNKSRDKFFSNNKGMELSINFIVVLIFSILILAMGIYLFTQIFEEGGELERQFSEQTQREINSLLEDSNDLIALPNVVAVLKPGEVGHFPIGIKADTQRCSSGKNANFKLGLDLIQVKEGDKVREPTNDERSLSSRWKLEDLGFTVNNNEKWSSDIPLKAGEGAISGNTYLFKVEVTCNNQMYDDYTHLLFLVVE